MVKAIGEIAGHLEVLFLVFTNRYQFGAVKKDIGGLQNRVGKQAGIDVVGVLPGLVFKCGRLFQLALIGKHIQKKI